MKKRTKAKTKSNIFICKRATTGEYWAYPSPFVAHGGGRKVRFRNLTGENIRIDFGRAPLQQKALTLARNAKGCVQVDRKAPPGLHEYVATVVGKDGITAKLLRGKPILVKGGSPPEIIIDT